MAFEPVHSPDKEIAKAEFRALNRALDDYFHLVRKRIYQAIKNQNVPDWWDVANRPAIETMFEDACAIVDKTEQDKLKIAGLLAIVSNFKEPIIPEEP